MAQTDVQDLLFSPHELYGMHSWSSVPALFTLEAGKKYAVIWDGEQFTFIAEAMNFGEMSGIGFGNKSILGIGNDTHEPFILGYSPEWGANLCFTTSTDASHKVSISVVEAGIVLKDNNGDAVIYTGVEKVKFNTSEGGTATFSKGEAVENVPIELNFSGGDMAVVAENGTLVKSVIVKKPDTLVPENIVKDIEIAGVVGTSKGGGGGDESWIGLIDGSAETITVPHGVTKIAPYAFYGYTNLKTVVLPSTITDIGTYAFYNCTALENIVLPESLLTLGAYSFYGCRALQSINIPSQLTSINVSTFQSSGLTTITIPSTVKTVSGSAFWACTSLLTAEIACATLGSTYTQGVFGNCTKLQKVWIRKTCTKLNFSSSSNNYWPFYNCTYPAEIYCEDSGSPGGLASRYWAYTNGQTGSGTILLKVNYDVTTRPW